MRAPQSKGKCRYSARREGEGAAAVASVAMTACVLKVARRTMEKRRAGKHEAHADTASRGTNTKATSYEEGRDRNEADTWTGAQVDAIRGCQSVGKQLERAVRHWCTMGRRARLLCSSPRGADATHKSGNASLHFVFLVQDVQSE